MALVLKNSLQDRLSSVFQTQSALGVITANPQLDVPLSIVMNSEVNSSSRSNRQLSLFHKRHQRVQSLVKNLHLTFLDVPVRYGRNG